MRTVGAALLFFIAALLAPASGAQTEQQLSFEVASIKPIELLPAGQTGFGTVTQDPSMISIKSVNLRSLLRRAYGLAEFQIGGPDWLGTQFYDLTAKLPPDVASDQIPAMLQKLLTERFRMTLRWDAKQETSYALVVDRGGPKLTPSADQDSRDGDQPDKPRSLSMSNTTRMGGATVAALASFLSNALSRPVVDSTGLGGRYDITLNISFRDLVAARQGPSPSATNDGDYTPNTVFDAVRDLGLRLVPQKVEVKHLTVVKADRIPTPN